MTKLFVGNLPNDVNEAELVGVFSEYGAVASVHMLSGQRPTDWAASAFVTMETADGALKALRDAERGRFITRGGKDGYNLVVRFPKSRITGRPYGRAPFGSVARQSLGVVELPIPAKRKSVVLGLAGELGLPVASDASPASTQGSSRDFESQFEAASHDEVGSSEYAGGIPSDGSGMRKIFIGNLPRDVTAGTVRSLLSDFDIRCLGDVHVMHGRNYSGESCAFARVTHADFDKCMALVDGRVTYNGLSTAVRIRVAESSLGLGGKSAHFTSKMSPTGNMYGPMSNICGGVVQSQHADLSPGGVTMSPGLSSRHTSAFGHENRFRMNRRNSSNSTVLSAAYAEPNFADPSVKTYHQFLLMPQSSSYGLLPPHVADCLLNSCAGSASPMSTRSSRRGSTLSMCS